jgi:hypothetical protein
METYRRWTRGFIRPSTRRKRGWGVGDVAFLDGELYAVIAGGGYERGNSGTSGGEYVSRGLSAGRGRLQPDRGSRAATSAQYH